MFNREIRVSLLMNNIKHYEIAEALGVTEFTFARWLRKELSAERKQHVLKAIETLSRTKSR